MYESFYGLRDKPFALLPDPAFLYLSRKHAAALSMLEYALSDQAGFVVITGEVGCGKTILIRRFLKLVDRDTTIGLISNTHNAFGDLLHWILVAFDIRPESDDKSALYRALIDYLLEQYADGRRTILVVDEAQNMSPDVLEELRLLSNLNADKDLLLQIILVGQPELLEKLRRNDLRQFAQRIAVNYHLAPLDYPESRAYIRHRLQVAGGSPALFTEMAMAAVHCCTGGIPRLINQICDMALVYGYAESLREVDFDTVMLVVEHRGGTGLAILPEASAPDRGTMRRRTEALLHDLAPDRGQAERPRAAPDWREAERPRAAPIAAGERPVASRREPSFGGQDAEPSPPRSRRSLRQPLPPPQPVAANGSAVEGFAWSDRRPPERPRDPVAPARTHEPLASARRPYEPDAAARRRERFVPAPHDEPDTPVRSTEPIPRVRRYDPGGSMHPREPVPPALHDEPDAPMRRRERFAPVPPDEPDIPVRPTEPIAPARRYDPGVSMRRRGPVPPASHDEPETPLRAPEPIAPPAARGPTIISLSDEPPPRDIRNDRDDPLAAERPVKRRRWVAWLI